MRLLPACQLLPQRRWPLRLPPQPEVWDVERNEVKSTKPTVRSVWQPLL